VVTARLPRFARGWPPPDGEDSVTDPLTIVPGIVTWDSMAIIPDLTLGECSLIGETRQADAKKS
jgi:hypothetical protein